MSNPYANMSLLQAANAYGDYGAYPQPKPGPPKRTSTSSSIPAAGRSSRSHNSSQTSQQQRPKHSGSSKSSLKMSLPSFKRKSKGKDDSASSTPPSGSFLSVDVQDKEKIGNLVKKRYSTKLKPSDLYGISSFGPDGTSNPLPPNAGKIATRARKTSALANLYEDQPAGNASERRPSKPQTQKPGAESNGSRKGSKGMLISEDIPPRAAERSREPAESSGGPASGLKQAKPQTEQPQKTLQPQQLMQALKEADFDAAAFIARNFADASAADIDKFTGQLTRLKEKLARETRENTDQNYTQILQMNKDLGNLQSEIKVIRGRLFEFTENMSAMKEEAELRLSAEAETAASGPDSRRGSDVSLTPTDSNSSRRRSLIVLEKVWEAELSSLYKHVDGAQKMLPAYPGRHLIVESGRWVELNSVTWKPLQPIHMFLLNDHLMVATRKRKKVFADERGPEPDTKTLIADQCWPLRDISLVDLGATSEAESSVPRYTVNIKAGTLSYIYQTERHDHYVKMVQSFKKAAQELAEQSRTAFGGASSRRVLRGSLNFLETKGQDMKRNSAALENFTARLSRKSYNEYNLGKQYDEHGNPLPSALSNSYKTLNSIDSRLSDIDVAIACHDYGRAKDVYKTCFEQLSQVGSLTVDGAGRRSFLFFTGPSGLISRHSSVKSRSGSPAEAKDAEGEEIDCIENDKAAENLYYELQLLQEVLKIKLSQRLQDLIMNIGLDLSSEFTPLDDIKTLISYLDELELFANGVSKAPLNGDSENGERRPLSAQSGVSILLASRSKLISRRVRRIELASDIPEYLTQVTIITFQSIKSTVEIFTTDDVRQIDSSLANQLIEWAVREVDVLATMVSKQLSDVRVDSETFAQSLKICLSQASQLKSVGINVDFKLHELYNNLIAAGT